MSGEPSPPIARWLAEQGLEKYAAVFVQNEVDLADLSELTDQHLTELGLPLGARIRFLKAARTAPGGSEPGAAAPRPQAQGAASERRPVTVMFCDIVGSTKLTSALDPEETRGLMLRYWRVLEQTAARHHGHIAQHLGDGALIYFGYPTAHEDDAERAVLAGLSLLEATAAQDAGPYAKLQLRIGIATGTVVLNEFSDRVGAMETLAIGHAVNLAARLQSLAAPDSVVIDGATGDLVSGLFMLAPLGEVRVQGVDMPVDVLRVDGVQVVHSRFAARRLVGLNHCMGRAVELDAVRSRWLEVRAGRGHVLLVCGEPGIGKSRLVAEIVAGSPAADQSTVQLQCSPHATSTPLHPLIEWLSRSAGVAADDRRDAIDAKLCTAFAGLSADTAVLAELVDRHATTTGSEPQLLRARTLSALVELFAGMSQAQPLLLVAEDLHWCDPTTLEFFQRLLVRARALPMLLLATARPEFHHDFGSAVSRSDLVLPRLERAHADDLTRQVLGEARISKSLLDAIAERADGVPLFVEELVRSLKDSGALVHAGNGVALLAATASAAIPRSLDSILMARVDMLGPNKPLAQMAACIGREFTLDLLAEVAAMDAQHLQAQVVAICESDLIVGAGSGASAVYRFRHALVRDAAYNSLLLSERRSIHGRIAERLCAAPLPPRPEVIAQHLTVAQQIVPAIEKWCEAGSAAKQRSSDAEAIEHLSQALQLVEQLPATPERQQRELAVLVALVAPLRAIKGFAAEDVAKLTARALALADDMKDARSILPLLYNNWVYTFVTSHRQHSEALARKILQRSGYDGTTLVHMTGLRAVAATQFTAGEFRQAAQHFDESIALYGLASQADLTHAVGLDGKVTALGYSSLTHWCLGDADRAHRHIQLALEHALAIKHISTTAFITYHQALLAGILERDPAVLQTNGSTLETIGREHRFEMWLICGKLLQSLARCLADPTDHHISVAEALFAEFEPMGVVYRPLYGTILADACLRSGNKARGLGHVAVAKALTDRTGERWSEAELYRLEGELKSDARMAAASFDNARRVATAQDARAWLDRITRSGSLQP